MHRALLALSLAAVMTLTACGGDADDTAKLSGDEQKAARSLAAEFQGNQPTAAQRDSGICLGKALVSGAGVKKLVSSGMLTEDLAINAELPEVVPPEIAAAYADAVVECQDPRAEIESSREFYPDATDQVVDDYVACMEDVDPKLLRAAVLESATKAKSSTASEKYLKATKPCTDMLGVPKVS
ncbi:hypothetical protein BJ980_002566 [Nocardioides daedukensis]|uniref:Lipoprotein n=1 Tax=Nocardioides daedukensis TaxID=634462 RepID=A0A7Y9S425_9ACTN|nr:hypothetical protein [Nocardioides daedukensis]NYG59643.1 hypothetical protein [Nocardioides daedukensis]